MAFLNKWIKIVVGVFVALIILGALVGTDKKSNTGNQNNNLDSQLKSEIEERINQPAGVVYLDVSNISNNNGTLSVSYATYQATVDNSVYSQMLEVVKITVNFYRDREKPNLLKINAVDRQNKTYDKEVSFSDATKFANGQLTLNDLISYSNPANQTAGTPTSNSQTPTQNKIIVGELSSFLPTRQDLSTEWRIDEIDQREGKADIGLLSEVSRTVRKDPQAPVKIELFEFETSEKCVVLNYCPL